MSTRCQIGFYDVGNDDLAKPDALLYRHGDGEPGDVLPDLVPFLEMFHARRGLDDTEYAAAWCMHHLITIAIQDKLKLVERLPGFFTHVPADGRDCHGFGVCNDFHHDIDFYYAVECDTNGKATLTVYSPEFPQYPSCEPIRVTHFRKLKTIKIKRESVSGTAIARA